MFTIFDIKIKTLG